MWRRLWGVLFALVALGLVGCASTPSKETLPLGAVATGIPEESPSSQPMPLPPVTMMPSPSPTPTVPPSPTPPPPLHLVASYPIDGDQQMPADHPLVLVFDHPVDQASLAASMVISPVVTGTFTWENPHRIRFTPNGGWNPSTAYTVTLKAGLVGTEGAVLERDVMLRFSGQGRGVPIPVLMYHHVAALPEDASPGQLDWTVSPAAFEEQMRYLEEEGWQSISTADLAAYLLDGEPLPLKPVMITVDDGNRSFYENGWPILLKTRLRPVLFIVPQFTLYPGYMNWDELRTFVQGGGWVGSHGYDHQNLRQVPPEALAHQLGESHQVLESELGVSVDGFCYPYGSFNQRTLDALPQYGYRTAYSLNPTVWQRRDQPLFIGRLRVDYRMSLEEFKALLP